MATRSCDAGGLVWIKAARIGAHQGSQLGASSHLPSWVHQGSSVHPAGMVGVEGGWVGGWNEAGGSLQDHACRGRITTFLALLAY